MTKQEKEVFELFLGKDKKYSIQRYDDFVYAIDYISLIFKHGDDDKTIKAGRDSDLIDTLYKNRDNRINLKYNFEAIKILKNEIKYKTVDKKPVECECCEGSGNVKWHYKDKSKIDDCPYCEGSGKIYGTEQVPDGYKFPNTTVIKIGNVLYSAENFYKAIVASAWLDKPLQMIDIPNKDNNYFYGAIGDYYVVICNIMSNYDNYKIYEIEVEK